MNPEGKDGEGGELHDKMFETCPAGVKALPGDMYPDQTKAGAEGCHGPPPPSEC